MPSKKTRKAILKERAIKYAQAGWSTLPIANEMGVHPTTVRRWLKAAGISRPPGNPWTKKKLVEEAESNPVPVYTNEEVPGTVEDTLKIAKHDARLAEDAQIVGSAEAHTDPKLAYKSFMVNMGMKKMRDGLLNMPPPRTIKEAEVLDQIIRRNADMDPKRGGAGGQTIIDISILNNPHTAMTPGGVIFKAKSRAISTTALELPSGEPDEDPESISEEFPEDFVDFEVPEQEQEQEQEGEEA